MLAGEVIALMRILMLALVPLSYTSQSHQPELTNIYVLFGADALQKMPVIQTAAIATCPVPFSLDPFEKV